MLHRDKKLKAEIDKLNKEKDWRMKRLKDLRKDDKELCEILFRTPYYIPTGTVPTLDQLRDLERHVKTQEEEKVTPMSGIESLARSTMLCFTWASWCAECQSQRVQFWALSVCRRDAHASSFLTKATLSNFWKNWSRTQIPASKRRFSVSQRSRSCWLKKISRNCRISKKRSAEVTVTEKNIGSWQQYPAEIENAQLCLKAVKIVSIVAWRKDARKFFWG